MSESKQNRSSETTPSDRAEEYLQLLNEHERSIAAYVHTLVPSAADAEDILQACRLTMWKNFARFDPGSHFVAWARKIALHQVLNHRRSAKRKPLQTVDPMLIEAIAGEIDRQSESLDSRSEALHECLRQLPEAQRSTILLRYFEDCDIAEIATRTSRTEGAVYRLLSRIRSALNDCVSRKLTESIS